MPSLNTNYCFFFHQLYLCVRVLEGGKGTKILVPFAWRHILKIEITVFKLFLFLSGSDMAKRGGIQAPLQHLNSYNILIQYLGTLSLLLMGSKLL